MPNLRPKVNMFPVQGVSPQSRLSSYPVTLSVRCVPHFLRPCPPGTQVAQTVQGSYNMSQAGISGRIMRPQLRPMVSLPQLILPRAPALMASYPNRRAFLSRMFTRPMQPPCIPNAYSPCPPKKASPMKPASVVDSPVHVIHLPPAPPPSNLMQPPCIPSVYNPCLPPKKLPMKPISILHSPLHVIHLPPVRPLSSVMQPPCVPSAYNSCPPQPIPTLKPTSVVDSPLHVIHLPPAPPPSGMMQAPCVPSAYNSCPPQPIPTLKPTSVVDSPLHVIHLPPAPPAPPSPPPLFFPRPQFVPVMCIPRPYYSCPPNHGVRKLSKPSHKKGKSRAFMPKPAAASFQFSYGAQPYMQTVQPYMGTVQPNM